MNDKRISIRPVLGLVSKIKAELFQNNTLRPILKLQHGLILNIVFHFCKKQKIRILEIKSESFQAEMMIIIKKNQALRSQLLGIVIGQFTLEEYSEYTQKETEYNKRILNMMAQRLTDSQSEFKSLN